MLHYQCCQTKGNKRRNKTCSLEHWELFRVNCFTFWNQLCLTVGQSMVKPMDFLNYTISSVHVKDCFLMIFSLQECHGSLI